MTEDQLADAYRRYGSLVVGRCRRILRDPAAAEDALQETFVRLWCHADGFIAAESKVAWLYRVAERCCFDQLARRRHVGEPRAEPTTADSGRALEDREIILRFLYRLDERVQKVAVLHYLDEMTQDEIAAATGWSRQTVWKKLNWLRQRAERLRRSVEQEGVP
jgi:RNA polymerase sigma-70 factor (ECF subfamily)